MAEKKKRFTAHEMAIELLTKGTAKSISAHFLTFIEVYSQGTVVPAKAIPELIEALRRGHSFLITTTITTEETFKKAIQELQDQLAEAKSKEEASEFITFDSEFWVSDDEEIIVLSSFKITELLSSVKKMKERGYQLSGNIQIIGDSKGYATFIKIDK